VATVLLGLTQIGGTPLSKGTDTGFKWSPAQPSGLVLSNERSNITCWLELLVPENTDGYNASLSATGSLRVYPITKDVPNQWIAVVAQGTHPEEMFSWPAGSNLTLVSLDPSRPNFQIADWRVHISDKDPDSQSDSVRRGRYLFFGLICLSLTLLGGAFEAWEKFQPKAVAPITALSCIQGLIQEVSGATAQETEWMRTVLTDVLIKRKTVTDALLSVPLPPLQRTILWFSTRSQFLAMLNALIDDLKDYLSRL
jgi:hypothetical protein